ncbi:MAG TPA: hypothetical protein VGL34_17525 [Steroidobacteraceae bacterium]
MVSTPSYRICSRTLLAMAVFAVPDAAPARAGTEIVGTPAALQVEAHDTTLRAVLGALGVRIQTSVDLSRPIDGTFKGSLREVITRLLVGYDFFLHKSANDIEVVVVGSSGTRGTTGAAPRIAPVAPVAVKTPTRDPFDRRGF